jgi:DNA repair protein RadA/Sms
MLLCDRHPGTPGSVVFASMEGRRPLLVEIQALVAPAHGGPPRRSASGYSTARLAQLLAVLDRRGGVGLAAFDVYVSVVGGVRLSDPGADLAVSLAVASAATGQVVDASKVVIGEVGLGGEVRQVSHTPRRLSEAARLGFLTAVTAVGAATDTGISVAAVVDLAQALDDHLGAAAPPPRARLPVG